MYDRDTSQTVTRALDFDALMSYDRLIDSYTHKTLPPMTFIILWVLFSVPLAVAIGSFISAGSKND